MNFSVDTLVNVVGGFVTIAVGWLVQDRRALRQELSAEQKRTNELGTRVAVLETKMDTIPEALAALREEVKGMRQDVKESMEKIHQRIDQKADR